MIIRKQLLFSIVFIILGSNTTTPQNLVEDSESGKNKIIQIMTHPETGVAAYNKKNIHYAETKNLSNDLNIPEIARFFECKTVMGQAFLTETLSFPIGTQDQHTILENRTNIIKALVGNPHLKTEFEQLITTARQAEDEIIELLSDLFIGKACPELKQLALMKEQNLFLFPFIEFMAKSRKGKTIGTVNNVLGLVGTLFGAQSLAKVAYMQATLDLPYGESVTMSAYLGLVSTFASYALYQDYTTGSEKRLKIHALNQFTDIAQKIENIYKLNGLQNQFNISNINDPQGIQLVQNINHNRYKHKKTIFFQTPAVHSFLYEIYQQENHLAEVFACIAEMDAYNSIAAKIIASKDSDHPFCFATFVEQGKPLINAQEFCNVLVKDAVTNNICEQKQIILTGPNAGGKTTAIRAILQSIVLAQTFGIAVAKKFEITMFDVIYSYLNISDDLLNGNSLFVSEVKRAQEVLQRSKSLESGKKFFFALDELFTGTAAEEGEKCAYEFIKRISEYSNIQFIYATHFNKLKELGSDNACCQNYKVNAPIKNGDGKLVYPFTLSQGTNETNIALDIAREARLFA